MNHVCHWKDVIGDDQVLSEEEVPFEEVPSKILYWKLFYALAHLARLKAEFTPLNSRRLIHPVEITPLNNTIEFEPSFWQPVNRHHLLTFYHTKTKFFQETEERQIDRFDAFDDHGCSREQLDEHS